MDLIYDVILGRERQRDTVIPSGSSFPSSPVIGQFFVKLGPPDICYIYLNGSSGLDWYQVAG